MTLQASLITAPTVIASHHKTVYLVIINIRSVQAHRGDRGLKEFWENNLN